METIVKTVHQIRLIIVDIAVSGVWIIICSILFLFLFLLGLVTFEEVNCMFFETCPPPSDDVYVD